MNKKDILNSVLSPIQAPTELPRTVFPTRHLRVGVRTNFVQEEPPDLQCLTKILATCVVEDVSKNLDILTLGILSNLGASSNFTWVYADTASSACPSPSSSLAMISITFVAVIRDADEPCSVKTACAPESSFTMSPRSATLPWYFWYFGSNFAFLRWQMSISVAKWTFFLSFCFQNDLRFALYFRQWPCWQLFELLPLLVHSCFRIRNVHCLRHRNKLLHQIVMRHRIVSFACDMIFIFSW